MNYESTFICSPELAAEKVEELTGKLSKIVESSKGTVKAVQQLGKKRLAYPINKFREGSYVYMELSGDGDMVSAIENFMRLNDGIVRFLTVKVEKKKNTAKPAPKSAESATQPEVKQNEPATEHSALA